MRQLWKDWQLFAEETGEESAPDAGEQGAEDFETLIRGRYKEAFDARVQRILDGRLRNLRQENMRLRQDAELRQRAAVLQAAVQRQRLAACVTPGLRQLPVLPNVRQRPVCRGAGREHPRPRLGHLRHSRRADPLRRPRYTPAPQKAEK